MKAALIPMLAILVGIGPAMAQPVADPPVAESIEDVTPGPPPPLPDLTDPNARAGESLNQPGIGSDIPKSLRGSGAKSGGPVNDLNPSGQPQGPTLPKSDLGAVVAGKALYHGNYCGTGNRGAGVPPIDALDEACMHHDACYDAAGYRSCACDATLRREASAVSDRPGIGLEVRQRALSVTEAATVMGCTSP
ncbi:phospholipase A2 family protein [Methylobacterium sp. NEAU K]|uniref:phospholipase A2 family protein n=1 Tax=Methylobacterium sp. NEAU K TaxID=3064946 RepID=UPI002732656C|nr:phospholipase A2 family protein [Methylobacterium sp. NEAU K]MDP4003476.1 phospholipase A2 family protein [Methylobacterium sp. NEAU K]